jgi:hypothetical protein
LCCSVSGCRKLKCHASQSALIDAYRWPAVARQACAVALAVIATNNERHRSSHSPSHAAIISHQPAGQSLLAAPTALVGQGPLSLEQKNCTSRAGRNEKSRQRVKGGEREGQSSLRRRRRILWTAQPQSVHFWSTSGVTTTTAITAGCFSISGAGRQKSREEKKGHTPGAPVGTALPAPTARAARYDW